MSSNVYQALMSRVSTLSVSSPALSIAVPEDPSGFDPSIISADKYLEVRYMPNSPAWSGINGGQMKRGILQIAVVWPKGRGLVAALDAADEVIDHFPCGHAMFSNGTRVIVTQTPWSEEPLSEPDKLYVPVTIPWMAS